MNEYVCIYQDKHDLINMIVKAVLYALTWEPHQRPQSLLLSRCGYGTANIPSRQITRADQFHTQSTNISERISTELISPAWKLSFRSKANRITFILGLLFKSLKTFFGKRFVFLPLFQLSLQVFLQCINTTRNPSPFNLQILMSGWSVFAALSMNLLMSELPFCSFCNNKQFSFTFIMEGSFTNTYKMEESLCCFRNWSSKGRAGNLCLF